MSNIMNKMATEILAKKDAMEVAIESDKAAILAANEAWNVATVAAANAHISAINATRTADAQQESGEQAASKARLDAQIASIIANELPPVDSIKEADVAMDAHMATFNADLAASVASLQADRDAFSTNVGDAASFSLNALEAYSVTGIE